VSVRRETQPRTRPVWTTVRDRVDALLAESSRWTGGKQQLTATRHPGYAISQRKRKLVEQTFGWMKTVGGLRKLRHRGGKLVTWIFTFSAAAYNIVRMRRLLQATA
jgi:hypothetical protein